MSLSAPTRSWARLRHLGARRLQLTTDATGQVNQVRDLLECAWPAVLAASGAPFRSASWRAAVAVVLDRCAGDLARVRRLGLARFRPRSAVSCPAGARPGRACGSSARSSRRWLTAPG